MKTILYMICQCTWGILQTILGLAVFLVHLGDKHYLYHGAIVTDWDNKSSVSLGLFIFVAADPYYVRRYKKQYSRAELANRLLVHEYGHTIQSLILGPLYLVIIGIPSAAWARRSYFIKKRRKERISYFCFYPEKWANYLGEKVIGEKSMENLLID